MKHIRVALVLSVLSLAACSSASGPTFSASELQPREGIRTYQVDCHGIVSSHATCMKAAKRMCGDEPVRVIDSARPYRDGAEPRTLVFQCGAAGGAPTPAPAAEAPAPAEKVALTGDAFFASGEAKLTPSARATLDTLLSRQTGTRFARVAVTGYADAVGSTAANLQLSQRRADSVAAYLRDHGVRADAFAATGRGDADPVATNATAEGRASNRRVEIVLQR
ncbi:OmpA family protein [Burkholderia ubonensis]|uniref:OmpA-like domain-containing protein n=1 Tax=Burkholderia ubonensis subsp. mesacidophila TaxID=265293 RepID=A0A2A4EWZ2_9BURK|nr:OmpA family protein [Burkholderia ubonensis]PCE24656.1 hypothetical protein BZL54_32805 [Burkholderia ubonensis subsp. mesacidophila]